MKKTRRHKLLTATGATAGVVLGATMALAHAPVTLYTYEEVAQQFGYPKMPVMVNAKGQGLPYSPKQSCGTPEYDQSGNLVSSCHDYSTISDHAFHSNQGVSEIKDLTPANTNNAVARDGQFNPTRNKPWTQSVGMIGKW